MAPRRTQTPFARDTERLLKLLRRAKRRGWKPRVLDSDRKLRVDSPDGRQYCPLTCAAYLATGWFWTEDDAGIAAVDAGFASQAPTASGPFASRHFFGMLVAESSDSSLATMKGPNSPTSLTRHHIPMRRRMFKALGLPERLL